MKKYENPVIILNLFGKEDIICASGDSLISDLDDNELPPLSWNS